MSIADQWNTPERMDQFFADVGHKYFTDLQWYFDLLADFVIAHVTDLRTVADVGCGNGQLALTLARKSDKVRHIVCVDYSQVAIGLAYENLRDRPRGISVAYYIQDIALTAMPEYTRCILCSETLEHVVDCRAALANMMAALYPGGSLIVVTPNGAKDDFGGHHHFWTLAELTALCSEFGRVIYDGYLDAPGNNQVVQVIKA